MDNRLSKKEIRRKVWYEIFLAPSAVLPIAAGATALLISWAAGGVALFTGAGIVGILGGLGWMATRAIFQVESITEKTIQEIRQKARDEQNRKLDDLMRKLRTDRDHRNDDYLIMLRKLSDEFESVASEPGVVLRSMEVIQQVRQLFAAAVVKLERSFDLWELSERLAGDAVQDVLQERERVLAEVKSTVDHLRSATQQYQDVIRREANSDLAQLQGELDTSLRIAKRTEERMREFETKPNYEEFLKE